MNAEKSKYLVGFAVPMIITVISVVTYFLVASNLSSLLPQKLVLSNYRVNESSSLNASVQSMSIATIVDPFGIKKIYPDSPGGMQ